MTVVGAQKSNSERGGAVAWVLSAQFFATQIGVAFGWSTHFSLAERYISDLGNTVCAAYPVGSATVICSPWHAAMNASFMVLGCTMIIGAVLTREAFAPGWRRGAAIALFVLAGLGVILVGIYPENENNAWHTLGAGLNFIGGNLALVCFGTAFRPHLHRRLAAFSIALGLTGLAATALFVSDRFLGLGAGGMERFAAYPMTLWQIVVGLVLWRLAGRGRGPAGAEQPGAVGI